MVQCLIPVFSGLLPEPFNSDILDLLFTLCSWHFLGKLRLHTDTTLSYFETYTTELGERFRHFATVTCPKFKTIETTKEAAARKRREGANLKATTGGGGRKSKMFNLNLIKFHLAGHVFSGIRDVGTTDNYSTQAVSMVESAQQRTANVILFT